MCRDATNGRGMGLVILLVGCLVQQAFASQLIKVPEDHPTIREAVDAAMPGSMILIGPGVYNESVVITTDGLRLIGREGLGTAVIDGTDLGSVNGVHVLGAAGVELRALTVQGFAEFVGPGAVDFRVGILVEDSTDTVIVECVARHNGDGVVLRNSDNSFLAGNSGHNNIHNGFFLRNNSDNNTVRENEAHDNGPDANPAPDFVPPGVGCGIQLSFDSDANDLRENLLSANGRGLQFDRGSTGNVAKNNESVENLRFGIAALAVGGQPAAAGNTIQNNVASDNGDFDLFDANFPPQVANLWKNNTFVTSNF